MNSLVNVVTKCVSLAGSAAFVGGIPQAIPPTFQRQQTRIVMYSSTLSGNGVRVEVPERRDHWYHAEDDDLVFELPVATPVKVKLSADFLPVEFFVGD